MVNALRSRPLTLTALLLLLVAVSVDLCQHGVEIEAAAQPAAAPAFACADCSDCGDAATGEGEHCDACVCVCHAVGILTTASSQTILPATAPIPLPGTPRHAAGFRADFERPPLAS